MKFEGGCYCGAIRYKVEGTPILEGQCHCRECQYISGGGPNAFIALPNMAFSLISGELASYKRSDVKYPVIRKFCLTCGTSVVSYIPGGLVAVKVGTMDNPKIYIPKIAIYTVDSQPFHLIPEGVKIFKRLP